MNGLLPTLNSGLILYLSRMIIHSFYMGFV